MGAVDAFMPRTLDGLNWVPQYWDSSASATGTQTSNPNSGDTISLPDVSVGMLVIGGSGLLTSLNVALPPDAVAPIGSELWISTSRIITLLNLSETGGTLILQGSALSGLALNGTLHLKKVAAHTWRNL